MEIQPYGTMVAVGVVASGAVGYWLAKRFSLDFNDIILLFAYGVFLGFVGAKGAYLLINIHKIPWAEVSFTKIAADGGFVFYGGLPLGALGVLLAGRIHKLELEKCLRICLPLLPLGHGFGRIGCRLAGCCYGMSYDGPFAVIYQGSLVAPNDRPLFPVQLLEAALLFLLAGVLLLALFKNASLGRLTLYYFAGYGIMRFCLEFLRGDVERGILVGLSTSQWVSLTILAVLSVLVGLRIIKEDLS